MVLIMIYARKSDIIEKNGNIYVLYWKTALDGKRWCRVKVYTHNGNHKRDYKYYFKTKKAAKTHILLCA